MLHGESGAPSVRRQRELAATSRRDAEAPAACGSARRWPQRHAWALALVVAICATACEPVFIFAGGTLAGSEEPAPADWAFSRAVDTVQIETRPDDPYSVNVWGVDVGAFVYVAASDGADSRWAQAIEADPRVRLKVGDRLFALRATRIATVAAGASGAADGEGESLDDEMAGVIEAYVDKYDLDRDDNFVDGAWVYRLQAR